MQSQVVVRPVSFQLPDHTVLEGELTRPVGGPQRVPLVILIHGSGANDMNETASEEEAGVPGGSAVFLQLARHLGSKGFAVLRYNKRGVLGVGPRVLPEAERRGPAYTISGYAADALHVLLMARTFPEIDPQRIFLLGHSEGTMIVSRIARQHPELLQGVIMVGTVGQPLRETLHGQAVDQPLKLYATVFDQNQDGNVSIQEVVTVARQRHLEATLPFMGLTQTQQGWQWPAGVVVDPQGQVSIQGSLRPALEQMFTRYPDLPLFSEQNRLYLKDAEAFGTATQNLPGYQGSVLMLQGSNDVNTPLSGAQATYRAVRQTGNTQVTLKVYPGLGHTLAPEQGGVPTLGPVAVLPLNDLTRWLITHSQPK